MKMRSNFWILVLVGYLLIPAALVGAGLETKAIENRELTELPDLTRASLSDGSFFAVLETVIDERNPLRPIAVEAASWIDLRILRQSPSRKVLLGDEAPWLYLQNALAQPCSFVEADKSESAERIRRLVDGLTTTGTEVMWTIAPSKPTIYPEHVTGRDQGILSCAQESNQDLRSAMASTPEYLDLFPLVEHQRDENRDVLLYYPHDSHWNDLGAYIWYEQVLQSLDPTLLDSVQLSQVETDLVGDLTTLIGQPSSVTAPALSFSLPGTVVERSETPVPDARAIRSSTATNPTVDLIPGATVIIHDSFGNPTTNWYQLTFEDLTLVHWNSYDPDRFAELLANADRVIIEVVERNAYNQLTLNLGSDELWNAYEALQP